VEKHLNQSRVAAGDLAHAPIVRLGRTPLPSNCGPSATQ
jgi:hypothetical protein